MHHRASSGSRPRAGSHLPARSQPHEPTTVPHNAPSNAPSNARGIRVVTQRSLEFPR
jgi:hypothetical protein